MSKFKQISVRPNQTIFDIALKEHGNIESIFDVLENNTQLQNLNSDINVAQELNIDNTIISDYAVKNYYGSRGLNSASKINIDLLLPLPSVNNNVIIVSNGSINNTFTLSGYDFDNTTSVNILGGITVDSVLFIDSNNVIVTYSQIITSGYFDVEVSNSSGTIIAQNKIKIDYWYDLKIGGDVLSIGSGINDDIRYSPSHVVNRTADGLSCTNVSNWASFIKFEFLKYTRGLNKKTEFIFKKTSGTVMFGIGSEQMNESSTSLYKEQELGLYVKTSNTIFGLYGNNGTPGIVDSQLQQQTVLNSGTYFKIKIESDGNVGSLVSVYRLANINKEYWDDESMLIYQITSVLTPNAQSIMPLVLPRQLGTGKVIGIRVK